MPAASSAIRAGQAFVELVTRDASLQAGLARAQKRMAAFAASVQATAKQITIAGAAMVAPFAIGTSQFARFEQAMARVKALTNTTGATFQMLSDEARRLGATTVFTASQAADAMGYFALAGFKVDQIMSAIGPTLNLAAAGQMGIADAADIAAKIMAGMGVEAKNVGYAIDVLTKAMTTANTDLRQLGDAMKYVGPIAKTAGVSLEETVAAVQLLSNAGIQAEMAGTTLRGALLSLTDPSVEAAEKMAELGVEVNDAAGNVRSLADIIDDFNASVGGMGTGERLAVIGRIFDARQAAGFAELLTQGGAKLREFTATLRTASGTSARIAATQLNTLTGSVVILQSAAEGLGISIGEVFGSTLRVALAAIVDSINATNEWVKRNRDAVFVAGAFAAATTAAGVALFGFAVGIKAVAFAAGAAAVVLGTVKTAMAATTSVLLAVASPMAAAAAGVAVLGAAFASSSKTIGDAIDWMSAKIGGVGEVLVTTLDGMRDALIAGDLSAAARVLWASMRLAWETGIAPLRDAWTSFRATFTEIAVHAFASVRRAWVDFTTWMYSTFPDLTAGFATAWAEMTAGLQSVWTRFQAWFTGKLLDIMAMVGDLTGEQVAAAKALGEQDAQDDLTRIEGERQRQIAEADRKAAMSVVELEQERQGAIERIEAEATAALAGIDRDADRRRADAEAELAAARAALADAVAAAKDIRRGAEQAAPVAALPVAARAAADGVSAAVNGFSSIGTFNPAAVFGIAGGDGSDRVVTEIRRLQQIAEKGNRVNEQQVAWLLQIAGSFA